MINTGMFFEGKAFVPERLARTLRDQDHYIATPIDDSGRAVNLLVYDRGVYTRGEDWARRKVFESLGEKAEPGRINTVIDLLREATKVQESTLNPHVLRLINVENGMLNWRTGELEPHSPDFLSTIRIHAKYDPGAKSELVDRFLREVLPDDVLVLAEEVLGYVLLPTTKFQKAFMLIGGGSNGKSVFLKSVSSVLGDGNVGHVALQDLGDNRFAAAELCGKLANIYPDLPLKALENSAMFKAIVTGDEIKAERKFQHPFTLRPYVRLIFSTNELPPSRDLTYGYFRRWCVIPFPNQFNGTKADVNLVEKLTTPEAKSAWLNHALTGLRRLEGQQGFSECRSVLEAGNSYRRQCDSGLEFIREELEVVAGNFVPKEEVYAGYLKWCGENGKRTLGQKVFNQRVMETLGVVEDRRELADGRRPRVWVGLAWAGRNGPAGPAGPGGPGNIDSFSKTRIVEEDRLEIPGQAGQSVPERNGVGS